MIKKLLLSSLLGVMVFVGLVMFVQASSKDDVVYPVAELGGCANETECRAFCSEPKAECINFAVRHNLMSPREAARAEAFVNAGLRGPGGCQGHAQCDAFCSDIKNIEACLTFAEEHDIMDPRELEEAKKVRDALRRGVKLPPGCETEANCKQTCERPSTAAIARQCFAFAKEAGLLPPDVDVAQAERAFQLIEDGTVGSFEELEQCDRRDAFDDQVLLEKCLKIGEAMGVVSSKEAAFIRATGGRGPGGCRGQECKTFCDDPKNRDECFRFTQEHPELIPETDRRHMEEGRGRIADALSQAPPEVKECIQSGVPNIQDIIDGRAMPSETIGNAIQKCFAGSFQSGGFGPGGPDDHGGPGGSGGFGPEPGGFDFPPEVKRCIETSGLSLDFTSPPSPGFEAAIQRCFEKVMGSREDPRGLGPDHEGGPDFHPEQFDGPPDHFDGSRPTDGDQFRRDQEDAIRRHIEEDARYRIEEEVRRNIELEQYRTQCIQRGGHWTGSNCEIPSSSSPSNVSPSTLPPQPTPPLDPAIECGNHGGVWTGAACEFPPQSSNPIVNFFAGVLTLFGVSY